MSITEPEERDEEPAREPRLELLPEGIGEVVRPLPVRGIERLVPEEDPERDP
jgi:hypothetical protein